MIKVITAQNAHRFINTLQSMFEMRYRIAVERWGWDLPDAKDGVDRDAFDDEHAIYFVYEDTKSGDVLATARLLPSLRPHLLDTVFASYCDQGGIPRSESVYELSRYIIDIDKANKELIFRLRGEMATAIVEFCLLTNIRAITWFTALDTYQRALRYWPSKPLGLPRPIKNLDQSHIAAISEMSQAALSATSRHFGIWDSALSFSLTDQLSLTPRTSAQIDAPEPEQRTTWQ